MRDQKDRRKQDEHASLLEDIHTGARDRRKQPDRRLENLNAEQRQLLLSEMPSHLADIDERED